MQKTILLAAAASFALGTNGFTSPMGRHIVPTSAGLHVKAKQVISGALSTLYDQNNNDAGASIVSQNFESTFDAYDSQAADDFTVPSGDVWIVSEVDVTGVYFYGTGPATSENVFFYKDKRGLPGSVIGSCLGVVGKDTFGSFAIKCRKRLKAGHYWVSVQVNMDFESGGEWGWEGSTVSAGAPAAWENPGDGFGTGCITYHYKDFCGVVAPTVSGQGEMFALKGKVRT